jgi:hypothetical protein
MVAFARPVQALLPSFAFGLNWKGTENYPESSPSVGFNHIIRYDAFLCSLGPGPNHVRILRWLLPGRSISLLRHATL